MSRLDDARLWLRARRTADAYRAMFETPQGRIVLRDLLRAAGLLEVVHTPGDATHTAFLDGRRSIGLEIIQKLRWTEGELHQLAAERTSERLATATEE